MLPANLKSFQTIILKRKKHSVLIVGIWCSGNTTDFDSVALGSIPSIPAKISRYSTMDSTRRYERWDPGSIPGSGSILKLVISG